MHVYNATSFAWVGYDIADADGAYSIQLPAGDYKLYLQPNAAGYPDGWYGGNAYDTATTIELVANQTLDITFPAGG